MPVRERAADRPVELDRLPEVAVPVVGGERGCVHQAAGDGGVERDVRGTGRDTGQYVQQLFPDGFNLRAVGGVVDGDGADVDAVGPVSGEQFVQCARVTGYNGGCGSVDRGDAQPARPADEAGAHVGRGQGNGSHPTGIGEFGQGPAP